MICIQPQLAPDSEDQNVVRVANFISISQKVQ